MSNNLDDSLGYDIQPSEENVNREIIDKFNLMKYKTIERDKEKSQNINILNNKDNRDNINNINYLNKLSLNEIKKNSFTLNNINNNHIINTYNDKEKDSYSRNIKK
jgi:hypothetical protein